MAAAMAVAEEEMSGLPLSIESPPEYPSSSSSVAAAASASKPDDGLSSSSSSSSSFTSTHSASPSVSFRTNDTPTPGLAQSGIIDQSSMITDGTRTESANAPDSTVVTGPIIANGNSSLVIDTDRIFPL